MTRNSLRDIVATSTMPHVFNYDKNKFEQVHAFKVPIRSSKEIFKRQRNGEYCKYLKQLEDAAQKKTDEKAERRS